MKLDIGAGDKPKEGYVGIDKFVIQDGIVNADMWDLPYPDDSVEAIYSSHALEHVGKFEVMPTLMEWKRVLAPGGVVEIIVPDLEWCIMTWLKYQSNDWYLDIIFGNQAHAGEFHKTGFTPKMLEFYLREAGFVDLNFMLIESHSQRSIDFTGRKAA